MSGDTAPRSGCATSPEFLELEEVAEGAGVGAFEAGFGAVEEGVGVAVGQALEAFGEGTFWCEWVVRVFLDVVDGCLEELRFDGG